MSIQHTAQTGKTCYLHVVSGKGGKAKYHFSKRRDGTPAESLPEGYEIYENVAGQVFLRGKAAQMINDAQLNRLSGSVLSCMDPSSGIQERPERSVASA